MKPVTSDEIRAALFEILAGIAPEIDPASIKPGEPLREQVDLDSFDYLNVIIALHERLHVDIPETDYQKLATLDSTVEYLLRRCGAAQTPAI